MTGNEKAIDLGLYVKSSLTYFLNIYGGAEWGNWRGKPECLRV